MKKNLKVMFSSDSNEWETPKWLFNALNDEFNFDLDPCASAENALAVHYFNKYSNCLTHSWAPFESVFCNPPYGRDLKKFVKKCYEEFYNGDVQNVVMLVPARTDTKYFHDYVLNQCRIIFIKGRLKFTTNGIESGPAPFPSMICVYTRDEKILEDCKLLEYEINNGIINRG